jgi:hypothetical protein
MQYLNRHAVQIKGIYGSCFTRESSYETEATGKT